MSATLERITAQATADMQREQWERGHAQRVALRYGTPADLTDEDWDVYKQWPNLWKKQHEIFSSTEVGFPAAQRTSGKTVDIQKTAALFGLTLEGVGDAPAPAVEVPDAATE